MVRRCWVFILLLGVFKCCVATELTFELPDSAKECFYEEIPKNTSCTLEYQVVTGGPLRCRCVSRRSKGQHFFHSYTFVAPMHGVYKICFSNEFSTFSHKVVYMDFQVGDEQPLPGLGGACHCMEVSAQDIHKALTTILDYQTHHRLREAQGRKRAEDLNERVLWWSVMESLAILTIAVGQVFILKNFFTEKKPYTQFK
ncbi:hypothetical protein NQ317_005422 [Molorchus minor]|uniref:GOLD domain-containing protein n=1 Tax=Molorchus minor TaxID=1323400 RepID=A0ABQ9JJK0_9CUCU|nr:hypothetical protein NQ317_005422 [Molorchus minor]